MAKELIALVNVPVGEIPAGITTAYLGDGSSNVQARMYKNMDDARTSGLDATLSYKVMTGLTLNAAYSYLDTKAHLYDASHHRMNTVVIDGTAHHKWNVSAMYSHTFSPSYALGVSLSGRGSSTRYYENNGNGKPFRIWRINTTLALSRSKGRLRLSVACRPGSAPDSLWHIWGREDCLYLPFELMQREFSCCMSYTEAV